MGASLLALAKSIYYYDQRKRVKALFYLAIGSIRMKCSVSQLTFCQYLVQIASTVF